MKIRISRINSAAEMPVSSTSHVMNRMVTTRSSSGFRVPAMLSNRIRRRMDSLYGTGNSREPPFWKEQGNQPVAGIRFDEEKGQPGSDQAEHEWL